MTTFAPTAKTSQTLTATDKIIRQNKEKVLVSDSLQYTSLLPIVKVRVEFNNLTCGQLYALLDTGAQPNIITADAVRQLRMPMTTIKKEMIGIDGKPFHARGKITIRIRPWFDSDEFLDLEFLVLPKDSYWNLVSVPINVLTDSSTRLATPITASQCKCT